MSRFALEHAGKEKVSLTCKSENVSLTVPLAGESGEDALISLSPEEADELAEWLGIYAREARTWA